MNKQTYLHRLVIKDVRNSLLRRLSHVSCLELLSLNLKLLCLNLNKNRRNLFLVQEMLLRRVKRDWLERNGKQETKASSRWIVLNAHGISFPRAWFLFLSLSLSSCHEHDHSHDHSHEDDGSQNYCQLKNSWCLSLLHSCLVVIVISLSQVSMRKITISVRLPSLTSWDVLFGHLFSARFYSESESVGVLFVSSKRFQSEITWSREKRREERSFDSDEDSSLTSVTQTWF